MNLHEAIADELTRLEETKTYKDETLIDSEQGAVVRVGDHDVVMLASNNYLGLASDPPNPRRGHPRHTGVRVRCSHRSASSAAL